MADINKIIQNLSSADEKITSIKIYLKNIYATKRFSFGTWTSRQHLIVAVQSGDKIGYAESIISVNKPNVDLTGCKSWSQQLIGVSIIDAILQVRKKRGIWSEHYVEMLEMALVDLAGKVRHVPALELLELNGKDPVYGVYVILSDDLEDVAAKAAWAVQQGKETFIKVKLFGDNQLDCAIIQTVRNYAPREKCYLIGDVNGGYCMLEQLHSVKEIAQNLERLYEAGLDACEDPGYISLESWVELQTLVGKLSLIPDYPLRPSRDSIHQILSGMGRIYNIHPDSAGSIIDAIFLAERIKELGAGVMIGDDSLVGPSATIWQQLAVGMGAQWVEATEKEKESDFYYHAVIEIPTDSHVNPIVFNRKNGFGIILDETVLQSECDSMFEVKCESKTFPY